MIDRRNTRDQPRCCLFVIHFSNNSYLLLKSRASGLFYLVNVNYERLRSRSLLINKGLINLFPSLTLI